MIWGWVRVPVQGEGAEPREAPKMENSTFNRFMEVLAEIHLISVIHVIAIIYCIYIYYFFLVRGIVINICILIY